MRNFAMAEDVIYCPVCHFENQDSANFCLICGLRLDQKMLKLQKYIFSLRSAAKSLLF